MTPFFKHIDCINNYKHLMKVKINENICPKFILNKKDKLRKVSKDRRLNE